MADAPRYRFAPSPTGMFHVGGARTALFNWALARQQGGTFVLRIEDTDEVRSRPEWTEGIIDALAWLGISTDDPHFEGPLLQSNGSHLHIEAADRLYREGRAYYCDMTPAEVEQRAKAEGSTGYGGWSRDLGLEPGPDRVLRFRVPDGSTVVHDEIRGDVEFDNAAIEDFVLLRRDGSPLFVLANVIDDINMGITHVVRGEEHLSNAPKQQMIWEALGHETPVWAHVPVMVNEHRKKLSKRRDKVALEQYRDEGYLADAMVNYLMTLGWSPGDDEIQSWDQMEQAFSLADVNLSPAFFDLKKLAAFNGEYIRQLSVDALVEACQPWLPDDWTDADRARFDAMAPVIQPRLTTLADAYGVVDFMFADQPEFDEASWDKTMTKEYAEPLLRDTVAAYASLKPFSADATKAALEDIMARYELKLGKAQAPVRVAVTGRTVGPPLFEALEVMGRAEVVRRIDAALERLSDA